MSSGPVDEKPLFISIGVNFAEIRSEIQFFSFNTMHLKMSSAKFWQFCLLVLDALTTELRLGHELDFASIVFSWMVLIIHAHRLNRR